MSIRWPSGTTQYSKRFFRSISSASSFILKCYYKCLLRFQGYVVAKISSPKIIFKRFPSLKNLDYSLNYYVLNASFADKWLILSYLPEHLDRYPSSRVIALHNDAPLISLFIKQDDINFRIIFIDTIDFQGLSEYFHSASLLSLPLAGGGYVADCGLNVTQYFIKNGFPESTIRHLHIINYPYFNELYSIHGVSYGILLKLLLYLPAESMPLTCLNYSDIDHRQSFALSSGTKDEYSRMPSFLLNVVNLSQLPLAQQQISHIVRLLESFEYRVLLNTAQSGDETKFRAIVADSTYSSTINIPSRLLGLVSDRCVGVIGVLGGGMNISCQFSKSHILSLQTPSRYSGVAINKELGDWGMENYWRGIDRDWKCLFSGRIVENHVIGEPNAFPLEKLELIVRSFIAKIESI